MWIILISLMMVVGAQLHAHCVPKCFQNYNITDLDIIQCLNETWTEIKCRKQPDDFAFYFDILLCSKGVQLEYWYINSKICTNNCYTITKIVPIPPEQEENCHALTNLILADEVWVTGVDKLEYGEQVEEKFAVFGKKIFCQAVLQLKNCSSNCNLRFPGCNPILMESVIKIVETSSLVVVIISAIITCFAFLGIYLTYEGADFICIWIKRRIS